MLTLDEIETEFDRMKSSDQGELVARLLAKLPLPQYDVSDEEVFRRAEELDSGKVEAITLEEVTRRP